MALTKPNQDLRSDLQGLARHWNRLSHAGSEADEVNAKQATSTKTA